MTTPCLRLAALLTGLLACLIPAHSAPIKFDLPAQPAAPALKAFISQSKAQVTYRSSELDGKTSRAVKGDYEPATALNLLLEGTGYSAEQRDSGIFVVTPIRLGLIEGSLRDESGRPVAGAKVAIADSDHAVAADRRGRFVLPQVPAGTHVLQIIADGLQNTRITDVTVNAGRELSLSPITIPVRKQGTLELETYFVSAKKNDGVVELDPYAVSGSRIKPFSDRNVDIPRTANDAQAYYIFDTKTIDQSAATSVEEFLKYRLTMNTLAATNAQNATNTAGNTSSINLRGLGTDKTLVLINGRRVAGVSFMGNDRQPDINGIPLSAIERIEVLPSSASGIYGGGRSAES